MCPGNRTLNQQSGGHHHGGGNQRPGGGGNGKPSSFGFWILIGGAVALIVLVA